MIAANPAAWIFWVDVLLQDVAVLNDYGAALLTARTQKLLELLLAARASGERVH